ncbi:MAG TPA: hypothetical protein V6C91_04250 [Coleofasciculaceae cyanobacterium]
MWQRITDPDQFDRGHTTPNQETCNNENRLTLLGNGLSAYLSLAIHPTGYRNLSGMEC